MKKLPHRNNNHLINRTIQCRNMSNHKINKLDKDQLNWCRMNRYKLIRYKLSNNSRNKLKQDNNKQINNKQDNNKQDYNKTSNRKIKAHRTKVHSMMGKPMSYNRISHYRTILLILHNFIISLPNKLEIN